MHDMKKFMISSALLASLLVASTAFAQTQVGAGANAEGQGGVEVGGRMMVRPVGAFGANASSTLRYREGLEQGKHATSTLRTRVTGRPELNKRPGFATSTAALRAQQLKEHGEKPGSQPMMPAIAGNGQPIVGGTVTAVSGSTITLTNSNKVVYAVSVASTTIIRVAGVAASLASVKVGDRVIVQGAINGSTVAAFSIIDQGAPRPAPTSTEHASTTPRKGGVAGFMGNVMGGLGGFFQHMFGF